LSGDPADIRKEGDRPDWLGPPGEHGGEYEPDKKGRWAPDVGCCLVEAVGSFAVLLGVGLSVYTMLP
jgi:hypothetical protein